MKKLLVLLSVLFVSAVAVAHTIEWYVDGSLYQTTTCNSGDNVTPPTAPAKYGYDFVEWARYYIRLEYIESTGTQYIDTGFKPNQNTRFLIEYSLATTQEETKGIAAARTEYSVAQFGILMGQNSFRSDYGNGTAEIKYGASFSNYVNSKVKADFNKNITTWYNSQNDIIQQLSHSVQTFQTSVSLYIFALNDAGTANVQPNSKVYSFQLYDNDVLIRNFIPARRPADNAIGMYDTVTGTFFENAGTGEFIAGPVIGNL